MEFDGGELESGAGVSPEEAQQGASTDVVRLRRALEEFVDLEVDEDGDLFAVHERVRSYLFLRDSQGGRVIEVFSTPATALRIDPALFRWVATAANRYRFGALSAYVRDDGLVNLNFAYSTPYDALTDDALRACVLPVVFTAGDLHREAVTLLSEG